MYLKNIDKSSGHINNDKLFNNRDNSVKNTTIKKQLLDNQHTNFMNEFKKDDDVKIPKLEKSLYKLQNKLNKHNNIETTLDIIDNIKIKKKKIKMIKKKKIDYLLDNSKHIFDYFENKKNITSDTPVKNNINKNKLIKSFFKINCETDDDDNNNSNDNGNDNGNDNDNGTFKLNDTINKYLCNINNTIVSLDSYLFHNDICTKCNSGELIIMEDEGILMCNNCFVFSQYIFDNEKPSYKEPPKEVCFYAYKRINHFKEILAQFQGKETTQIPKYIIENIKLQIIKERIDIKKITNGETKNIIKKLGYNKYYEHIPFIKEQLGIKPPNMSPLLEETLCNLFMDIQVPYSKFCPDNRVNFLNYYYTAFKLCELLGETSYLPHFQMLKDRDKRIEQDGIWKQICAHLNWVYIPTI
jgi:hypothetical protein